MYSIVQNSVAEISFISGKIYNDTFNEVELDVVFQGPKGLKQVVPAFWAGENVWKVRFSSHEMGKYSYYTLCSDKDNNSLIDQKGEIQVHPYQGNNPLLKNGPLRVSDNHRYLEHINGSPFFWLGEIWIFGLCKRISWPEDFRTLVQDRVKKGFTVITLTAGLYPGKPFLNERDANEAGLPWDKEFRRINPAYFDMADLRIEYLIQVGLLPCIYGSWGYILPEIGIEKMKKHWRYLIARYGAYPVVWCVAGEQAWPYENSTFLKEREILKKGWTKISRYIREIDPYHRILTTHPSPMSAGFGGNSRSEMEDPSLVDFEYLQTAHGDWYFIGDHIKTVIKAVNRKPRLPVIVGEVCYEGHLGTSWEDIQRFIFWSSILSGTCGHTYGAEGVFTAQTGEGHYSDRAGTFSRTSWKEAYQFPGSKQVGIGKKLLERYPWWQMEPHPEWVKTCRHIHSKYVDNWVRDKYYNCYAAGVPREFRLIYFPSQRFPQPTIQNLESDITYNSYYFDPRTGEDYPLGRVIPNKKGEWSPPKPFIAQDGLLILEKEKSRK